MGKFAGAKKLMLIEALLMHDGKVYSQALVIILTRFC